MLFVSYSRQDSAVAKNLSADLVLFGHDVWLDERLEGGEEWWEEILDRIRGCDTFLYVVSETSLRSKPCREELTYALAVNRPVVPIALQQDLEETLPHELAGLQVVEYAKGTKHELADLLRALSARSDNRASPDPLPPAPSLPASRYTHLLDEVLTDRLNADHQVALLRRLHDWWEQEGDAVQTLNLLATLRSRADLLATIAPEVDGFIEDVTSHAARSKPGPDPWWKAASPTRTEGVGFGLGGLAAVALILAQFSSKFYEDCSGCRAPWGEAQAPSRWPYIVLLVLLVTALTIWFVDRNRGLGPFAVLATGIVLLGTLGIDVAQLVDDNDTIASFSGGLGWTMISGILALTAGTIAVTLRFGTGPVPTQ